VTDQRQDPAAPPVPLDRLPVTPQDPPPTPPAPPQDPPTATRGRTPEPLASTRTPQAGPGGAQPPSEPLSTGTTLVVEEGVFPSRLRRPRDLVGAVLGILGALLSVAVALAAQATTIAIDSDLAQAQRWLPDMVWAAMSALAGLGLLMLPFATAASMLVRGRGRQLLEAVGALTLATITLSLVATLVRDYGSDALYRALTGLFPWSTVEGFPTNPLLGGLVAFVTTARLMSRPRWNVIASLIIGSAALVATVSGTSTIAAQGLSLLVGVAIGLLVRYVLGTPTTRPSGTAVAGTLMAGGIPLTMLRARGGTESGRRYLAVTSGGEHLDVVVLDRDLEGSGLLGTIWRSIRLRESNDAAGGLSMRTHLDQAALMAYAAESAGVPSPRLLLAAMVSADSALLVYEAWEGRVVQPGATTEVERPTAEELDAAWRAVQGLHQRFLAHQDLHAEHVVYAGPHTHLTGLESGVVAAGDVVLRLDIAELLVTQALQTSVAEAVASARRVIGDEGVLRALPVLQRVAMSGPTRAELREHKFLLSDLRGELLTINPAVEVEPIDLERLKPRTVITIILGTIAGYLLLSQLVQVDVASVIANADWRWAGVALVLSFLTYVGAALSLSGFVPDRLRFLRTLQAQFAASFATLVSPPTLGAVAVNARYLNRAGLPPAAAAATVGVSQVSAFIVHVGLLLVAGIAAGTQADLSFNPPRWVIVGIGVLALAIGGLTSVAAIRRWLTDRIRPLVEQVIPRLATVAQRPGKLVEGFGGILLLNVAYGLCLVASVRAFTSAGTVAAIFFVYLAGSTIGQAAPTPGGLGVVEAALAAGLTAAGLDGALAVSATLLFRFVTFWLPTVPGWFAFRGLANRGLL
jgi:uncharacterized membrane protein YbhN (UPF0104 family)